MLPHNCHVLTYINIYVYNKCVKFILLLKHTLKNKHLIITRKKKKKKKKPFPITRDINKENKKVHNSRMMYIKGEKKKTLKSLKRRCFDVFLSFTKTM